MAEDPNPSASPAARLDAQGRERPRFLLAFPQDPALDRLVGAFEAGNFALVRREAPRLAREASNPTVRAAALELQRRISPDRAVIALLVLAVSLLSFVAVWAYW